MILNIWTNSVDTDQTTAPIGAVWSGSTLFAIPSTSEPPHDNTNKMACAPSEDSDQPGHPPSLIRAFAVCMKKAWFLSYPLSAQRRLWSDWADAQADLSLRWAHSHFGGFVMRRLKMFLDTLLYGKTTHFKFKNNFSECPNFYVIYLWPVVLEYTRTDGGILISIFCSTLLSFFTESSSNIRGVWKAPDTGSLLVPRIPNSLPYCSRNCSAYRNRGPYVRLAFMPNMLSS